MGNTIDAYTSSFPSLTERRQSEVEIKHYPVAYFDCVIELKTVLLLGAELMHAVKVSSMNS